MHFSGWVLQPCYTLNLLCKSNLCTVHGQSCVMHIMHVMQGASPLWVGCVRQTVLMRTAHFTQISKDRMSDGFRQDIKHLFT
jgi:hypothetical protein